MGSNSSKSSRPLLPIPDNLDPPFRCFCLQLPDDPAYITMLAGKVKELATWTSYEYAGNPGDRTILVGIWERVLEQLGDAMCCCDQTNMILQFQIQAIFNQWVNVTNNTDINIYAPVTTFITTAGESPEEDAARGDALCYAINALVDAMCEAGLKQLNDEISALNLMGVVSAIVTAVLGALSAGAGYILGAAVTSALFFGAGAIEQLVNADDLQNTAARQELACALREALAPLAPTEANLWSTVDGLTGLGTVATHLKSLMSYLHVQAQYSKQIFQSFINALGEGKMLALAGVLPPCPCDETCALYPEGDWDVIAGTVNPEDDTIYLEGNGDIVVDLNLPGGLRTMTSVTWQDKFTGTFCEETVIIECYDGSTLVDSQTIGGPDYHTGGYDWTNEPLIPPWVAVHGVDAVDRVRLIHTVHGSTGGTLLLRSITICWE